MAQPIVLYHASPTTNIRVFEPQQKTIRDAAEGPVVFATPDKALAATFLIQTDNSWAEIGKFGDEPWHMVVSDKERFVRQDVGGAIYHLPPDGFRTGSEKGMGDDMEWTSKDPAVPISKEVFTSGIDALKELGVRLYYVGGEMFKTIQEADDQGAAILSKLRWQ